MAKDISPSPTETLRAAVHELATGSTFAGRHQVIEELGKTEGAHFIIMEYVHGEDLKRLSGNGGLRAKRGGKNGASRGDKFFLGYY